MKFGVKREGIIFMTPGSMKKDEKPFRRKHKKENLSFLFLLYYYFLHKVFKTLIYGYKFMFFI